MTIALASVGPVALAQAKNDRENAGLVGSVKSVRERSYNYMGMRDYIADDKSGTRLESGDTVTYNPKGNEIERIMVSDFGEPMGKQIQDYDDTGLLKSRSFLDSKGAVQESSSFNYSEGKLTQILHLDASRTIREKTIRNYNSRGNLSEEVYFDPVNPLAKTVYKYDGKDDAIEMAYFLASGEKAYAPVGPCLGGHRVTYTYDERHRPLTKAVFEVDGRLKKSWAYDYDDLGNTRSIVVKNGSSSTNILFNYEYDRAGNWIKRTSVTEYDLGLLDMMLKATGKEVTASQRQKIANDSKITWVTTREITYY